MALDSVLTTLAEGFRIDLDSSGAANRQFTAQLLPPPGSLDDKGNLNVTDLVTSTQVTPSPVDVSWRTQDVRFANTDIANALVLGGLPINDLLALNVGSVTNGATSPPGVPGLLGILTGTIPLPIEVTAPKTFTVTLVDVRWRVRDANGQAVAGVSWSLAGAPSGTSGDIAPPIGRALDPLTLVFDLAFAEQTSSFQPLIQRRLEASVRLQAGGVSTGWIDLPPVDLQLPVIPVPTIAVFCQDTNFGSNKLVVVPGNSPFDQDTLQAAFQTLRDTLDPLRSTFSFLGLFLDAAGTVADLLSGGNVAFRKADEISNLNDIDLESGFFNDTEAEDELSSLILVGPPHRRIEGFNDQSFSTSQGQIDVTIGTELIVQVASLHSASPASIPPGRVGVPFPPDGSRFLFHDITTFGDELSSLRFAWES
jgi:hypothetical protein